MVLIWIYSRIAKHSHLHFVFDLAFIFDHDVDKPEQHSHKHNAYNTKDHDFAHKIPKGEIHELQ